MNASLKDLGLIEAGHLEQLGQVKSEAAESQQKAVEAANQTHSDRIRDLEQKLHAAEADAAELRSSHATKLENLESQRTSDHEGALHALRESHAAALSDLEDQLKLSDDSMETVRTEHAEQLIELEDQLSSHHAQTIDSLKMEHAKQLENLESKMKSGHDEALEQLRSSLAEEKRQLESQARSLQQELQGARTQAQMMKSILQDTEKDSREKEEKLTEEVEKLRSDMSTSVMKLARMSDIQFQHDQLAAVKDALEVKSQEDLEALRRGHEKALSDLQSGLTEQHRQVVETLRDEHTKSIESSHAANQSKHEELQRKMKEDHDNQLDEIMKTLEGQWRSQVDQLEEQNAAASLRLSTAETDREKALQILEAEQDAAFSKMLAELQEVREAAEAGQSSAELDQLRAQLAQSQEQAKELDKMHSEALHQMESILATVKQELTEAREAAAQQQKQVEELEQKHGESSNSALQERDSASATLQKELADAEHSLAQLKTPMKELEQQHNETLDSAFKQREIALASIQQELQGAKEAAAEHVEQSKELEQQHSRALAAIQQELQTSKEATVKQLEQSKELEKQHSRALDAAVEGRESALASMKQQLAAVREASLDHSRLDELNQKYLDAQNELAALQKEHDQAIHEAKRESNLQLEKVLTELNDAKQAAESVPTSKEADTIHAGLVEAKKTIISLESELEGALLEIETQRNLADSAQKELEQLKAQAISLSSPKRRRKSRSPRRKSMNPLSPATTKPGLESSKWASPTEVVPALRGGSGDEDNTTADPEGAPVPVVNGKPRNITGQLAGIHEQIKQLDEMSEHFLEDHQKMASILSRVDDQTQTATVEVEEEQENENGD